MANQSYKKMFTNELDAHSEKFSAKNGQKM
jgi:hypothetical protein